jgi:AcrR family transcriptional regulator
MAPDQRPAGVVRGDPGESPPAATPRLRADAARNREAVLCAARTVFARDGLSAPLEEIARTAGVGIGTLYRRFGSRDELIAAALVEQIAAYADAAEQALAEPDPWAGFAGFAQRICELQAGNRGLADLLVITLASGQQIESIRARANRSTIKLIERAKATGQLRADMVSEDLLLLLIGSSAIAAAAGPQAPQAMPRFVALMLAAFRPGDDESLPPPPSRAQMRRVMATLAAEHGCGLSPGR